MRFPHPPESWITRPSSSGGDTPSATIIANVGPYEARGVSIDGSLPLIGKQLVLPIGVSTQLSARTPSYGPILDTHRGRRVQARRPCGRRTRRSPCARLSTGSKPAAQETFPLFFTAGNFLPPPFPKIIWARIGPKARNVTLNLGGLISAQLTNVWLLKTAVFRSTNSNPISFADQYTDINRTAGPSIWL